MRTTLFGMVLFCALFVARPTGAIDVFDRHTSFWVQQAARNNAAVEELSSRGAAELKALGPQVTTPCIVVKTSKGNWAKALVTWNYFKRPGAADGQPTAPLPVVVLQRFVTYDRDRRDVAIAHGSNVMLFPGYEFDFDLGQIVPAQLGGDLGFNQQRRLVPLGNATLHGLDGSALPPATDDNYDPADHTGVRPRDFSGDWQVDADGRWRGTWQISVDESGEATGQYTSDETKSVFQLRGRVVRGQPQRLQFIVQFANADQHYDMLLWTTDKSAMAGTTTLLGRTFGVSATRIEKPRDGQ